MGMMDQDTQLGLYRQEYSFAEKVARSSADKKGLEETWEELKNITRLHKDQQIELVDFYARLSLSMVCLKNHDFRRSADFLRYEWPIENIMDYICKNKEDHFD